MERLAILNMSDIAFAAFVTSCARCIRLAEEARRLPPLIRSNPTLVAAARKLVASILEPDHFEPALQEVAAALGAERAVLLAITLESANQLGPGVRSFSPCHGEQFEWLPDRGGESGLCCVIGKQTPRPRALVLLRSATSFSTEEQEAVAELAQLSELVLEIAARLCLLEPPITTAGRLVNLLPAPCLLTDIAGRCVDRNDAFAKVLQNLSGVLRGGRIFFDDSFLQSSWQQALLEAQTTAVTQSLLASGQSGVQWKAHVIPFACGNGSKHAAPLQLMLVYFERFNGSPDPNTIPASRPLTKAELEVLANLLLGQTAKVIARARGASVNTVRSQITSILGKTGHRTQKELIASFGSSSYGGLGRHSDYEEADS